jgi:HEAT repeat protein
MAVDGERREPSRSLAEAVAAIQAGDLAQTRLTRLSDLSRDEVRTLADAWDSIPEETRARLVSECEQLSEDRVELNFRRLMRLALEDQSPVVRQLAIGGLWEDESGDLLERLRQLLQKDGSPDVRAAAAGALERFAALGAAGSLRPNNAAELRAELLQTARDPDTSYTVQRRTLESLGPFASDPEVSALIRDAYASGDHGLQCSAVYAMGRSQESRWLPEILAELESEEPELRYEAARAAGQLGSADALPVLVEAAHDEDVEVRQAVIGAIGQIGGRGAVRALERLAADAGESDLELIEAALEDVNTILDPFA